MELTTQEMAALFAVASGRNDFYRKEGEPQDHSVRRLYNDGYLKEWEGDTGRYIAMLTHAGKMELQREWLRLFSIEKRARHTALSDYSAAEEVATAIDILGYDPRREK